MVPYSFLLFKICSAAFCNLFYMFLVFSLYFVWFCIHVCYLKNLSQWIAGKPYTYQQQGLLMQEQLTPDLNPLFMLIHDTSIERKCSTRNGLITTYGPVSYWLRYKAHHKHSESTSLITYFHNMMFVTTLLTRSLRSLVVILVASGLSPLPFFTAPSPLRTVIYTAEWNIMTLIEVSMAKHNINNFSCI